MRRFLHDHVFPRVWHASCSRMRDPPYSPALTRLAGIGRIAPAAMAFCAVSPMCAPGAPRNLFVRNAHALGTRRAIIPLRRAARRVPEEPGRGAPTVRTSGRGETGARQSRSSAGHEWHRGARKRNSHGRQPVGASVSGAVVEVVERRPDALRLCKLPSRRRGRLVPSEERSTGLQREVS